MNEAEKLSALDKLFDMNSQFVVMEPLIKELKKAPNERLPTVQYYLASLQGKRNYQYDVKNLDHLVGWINDEQRRAAPVPAGAPASAA